MQTGNKATCIFLQRGTEDKELLRDIEKVAYDHYGGPCKLFYEQLPILGKLLQGLREEIENQ